MTEQNTKQTKIQIKSFVGTVLFEHECETIKECVEKAILSGATLSGADLPDANLYGANLYGADLRGANLYGAVLRDTKQDFIDAISKLPDEIPNLRNALMAGKIDGSTYGGECACLAGTIAKHMGKPVIDGTELGNGFVADCSSPRERLFRAIRKGDTPENNPISKIVVGWIDEAFPLAKEAA